MAVQQRRRERGEKVDFEEARVELNITLQDRNLEEMSTTLTQSPHQQHQQYRSGCMITAYDDHEQRGHRSWEEDELEMGIVSVSGIE